MKRYFFLGCLILGTTLLAAVIWPILQFKVWELSEYKDNQKILGLK